MGTRLHLEPTDVDEAKGKSALERYSLQEVELADPIFLQAYGVLDAVFGPRGELERRTVVESWLRTPPAQRTYHLLVARDHAGALAAVRDCHVRVDRDANVVVAYLAHTLVMPAHRRSGLASLLRAAPLALARRLASAELPEADLLLAAEMEPYEPGEEESLVRLVAYASGGFSAIAPSHLPYSQPDFRDPAYVRLEPKPVPLVAIVRWVGHEHERNLPKRLAEAYLENLYAVFATHCSKEHVDELRERTLRALAAKTGAERTVPLCALPTGADDEEALRPLRRDEVLAHRLDD
jgi:hypothetical protein